jgi:homospermidine synthase
LSNTAVETLRNPREARQKPQRLPKTSARVVEMPLTKKHLAYKGRVVMIGFGSIGEGALPLLLRHIDMKKEQVVIITADQRGYDEAVKYGVEFINRPLSKDNCRAMLEPLLREGDFIVNVSVDVSSADLIKLCREKGAFYIDTCIEPWAGGYTDANLSVSARSNYGLREDALGLRKESLGKDGGPTAVLTHGANPGLVSHFVKQALLNMAKDTGLRIVQPKCREDWAKLAEKLGIKAIHIAERDTQVSKNPKQPGEFINTWSIDGFYGEGAQPAELGWGTHEKELPADGRRHEFGCDAAIYLERPGYSTRVRSWTPLEGPYHGFLITHSEAISIADYLTLYEGGGQDGGKVRYRPTCHYAYHPCDAAVLSVHEMAGKGGAMQPRKRLLMDDIIKGVDELGVLLMGNRRGVYWYGSRLSIEEARRLAPYNNATSLQVTSAVLAGVVWALENPNRGVVEPDDMDFARVIDLARPYLGEVVGVWGDWNPLMGRGNLFAEDVDATDPWQFKNIRVL